MGGLAAPPARDAARRDLAFTVSVLRAEADPVAGPGAWEAWPRLQLAMPLGDRLGLTAEIGIDPSGESLDTPAASLKVLLREPGAGRTGFAAALDLFGSTHSMTETEAGLGLGALRSLGPVTFRGVATIATGVSSWTPHLHAGLSAALELGRRWRTLGEVVADVDGGEVAVSAGPTLKVALGASTALAAGALFRVGPARADPVITVQLTQGI